MHELPDTPETFTSLLNETLQADNFVKLSLGNYQGPEQDLKQVLIRQVEVKRKPMLAFTFRYRTRDIVKNLNFDAGTAQVAGLLQTGFRIATLFSLTADYIFEHHVKSGWKCRQQPATKTVRPGTGHDHVKQRPIANGAQPYLRALGITGNDGQVLKHAQDKYKQINQYIKLLEPLIREAGDISQVADMGSGKGYLTFALYDYLTNVLAKPATVTGVEYREDLVALCNQIAAETGFENLRFEQGNISDFPANRTDLLIALHACDTATDDAIYKGIEAQAKLIVVAPCCHKEVRREMEKNRQLNQVSFLTRHGIFLERQAEMVTDGLRAMLLEYAGYKTRVFEFISDAHTPKNVLIVGIRSKCPGGSQLSELRGRIEETMTNFGITRQRLQGLLLHERHEV
ncbi:SAM-dependent methyltransferase [Pedobacter yulinensis]|uniref:SAM-dependent methyltransferase n=1 Tax=Pedobacter yulinensis TaxID=2126353 RepID=A0A2T3HPT3_9SPHI|nr:SAM-dependent methyltransferase [Pedobacter yulinensis]PST84465.1 SAM-dependent methyltransferase [Pedobacter yulinensis]